MKQSGLGNFVLCVIPSRRKPVTQDGLADDDLNTLSANEMKLLCAMQSCRSGVARSDTSNCNTLDRISSSRALLKKKHEEAGRSRHRATTFNVPGCPLRQTVVTAWRVGAAHLV